jgi:hypothetical protein
MNGIFKLILIAAPVTGLILWLVMTQQEQHREIMQHDKQEFKQQVQKFDDDFADAWASKPITKTVPAPTVPAGETQEAELRAARKQLGEQIKQQDAQSINTITDALGAAK